MRGRRVAAHARRSLAGALGGQEEFMDEAKKCPVCGLINPHSALRCDCGFDFRSGALRESYLDPHRTIRLPGGAAHGISNLSREQLMSDVQHGGRFVVYQYCFSVIVLTFKRPSDVYYIAPQRSAFLTGLRFSLVSLILGWWGISWGPIWTVSTIAKNCMGGVDVTGAVVAGMNRGAA